MRWKTLEKSMKKLKKKIIIIIQQGARYKINMRKPVILTYTNNIR